MYDISYINYVDETYSKFTHTQWNMFWEHILPQHVPCAKTAHTCTQIMRGTKN